MIEGQRVVETFPADRAGRTDLFRLVRLGATFVTGGREEKIDVEFETSAAGLPRHVEGILHGFQPDDFQSASANVRFFRGSFMSS